MAEFTDVEVASVERWLRERRELEHVCVGKRADTLVLESDPPNDSLSHARLRRVVVHLWTLEMPSHNRWQPGAGELVLAKFRF